MKRFCGLTLERGGSRSPDFFRIAWTMAALLLTGPDPLFAEPLPTPDNELAAPARNLTAPGTSASGSESDTEIGASAGSEPSIDSGTYSSPVAITPAPSSANAPVWEGGKLPFLVSATTSETYDDNIFVQPVKTSDFITQIKLKGEYQIGKRSSPDGNFLSVAYAPSYDAYAEHSGQNSFNQAVSVDYQHRFSKLSLGLSQSYAKENSASAAEGNLVQTTAYTTDARADYAYSHKVSFTADFTQNVNDSETVGFTSSKEWVGTLFCLYKLDSKISLGLGPEIGLLEVEAAPRQTYEQLLARVNYAYSGKLTFNLSTGAEYRQYQGAVPATLEPVFNLAATYQASNHLSLTLSGQRHFEPSYSLAGQDYIATSISFTARERFLRKFTFDLAVGYENDSYQFVSSAQAGPSREDDYYTASAGIGWNATDWLVAAAYWKYQRDDSTLATSTFDDNQLGVSVSASY